VSSDPLDALQEWYAAQCDGDWEHQFGVTVDTLDNPGWTLRVDLTGTPLEALEQPRIDVERTENDWIECWTEQGTFNGAGGPRNLTELLRAFERFADRNANPS